MQIDFEIFNSPSTHCHTVSQTIILPLRRDASIPSRTGHIEIILNNIKNSPL